jgi:hypothetical protein
MAHESRLPPNLLIVNTDFRIIARPFVTDFDTTSLNNLLQLS